MLAVPAMRAGSGGGCVTRRAGIVKEKREPFSASDSAHIRPPRCSMIHLQIASPSPLPSETEWKR
jgi:hypothetical protein